jgi:hypothetical protein
MNRATPQMRGFAKRLMALEAMRSGSSIADDPAVFPVTNILHPQLAALMGNGGFRALLARALSLAQAEVPWLDAFQVDENGVLEGLLHPQPAPTELLQGRILLLAHLLGLLGAFIGPGLVLRLVSELWPEILLEEGESGDEWGFGDEAEK